MSLCKRKLLHQRLPCLFRNIKKLKRERWSRLSGKRSYHVPFLKTDFREQVFKEDLLDLVIGGNTMELKRQYIIDEDNHKVAVQLDIDTVMV